MDYNINIFNNALIDLKIKLNENQINKFLTYYEMLIEKNKVMNLTAITEYSDVIIKHFIDSLSLVKTYDLESIIKNHGTINILDIGTGAGFPGIPLKIAFPDINIVLVDSLAKRISFLNEIINSLNLNSDGSINTVHSRAEDYIKNDNIRESFDLVVSRAVANLSTLSEYCIPYIKVGGYFIPYKAEKSEEEITSAKKALDILGGDIEDINTFMLPQSEDISRTLIKIKKTHSTPDIYPRKAGLPSKKPL